VQKHEGVRAFVHVFLRVCLGPQRVFVNGILHKESSIAAPPYPPPSPPPPPLSVLCTLSLTHTREGTTRLVK